MAPGGSDAELGDAGRRSGKRQRKRYLSYLRRPTFLKSSRDRAAEPPVQDGGVAEDNPLPTHLVVMVNGIVGSAADWKYAAKQFVKKHPVDIMVHCSESNHGTLTLHGVDVMGERLAKEIISVVASKPFLQKISFVGHSLGGLIARYAIGILYEKAVPNCSLEEHVACEYHPVGVKSVDEKIKGKIAGLEPINFITFATPHLGSRLHKQIPFLHGSYKLEKMAYRTCWIFRRSGKHLFLKDHDNGKLPLLVQMVNDCGDLRFMSALQSFKRRVAYSNVCFDFIVGRKTSSIRHEHELPKRQDFMINSRYPHIVHVEEPTTVDVPQMNFPATTKELKTISDMEDAMIDGLNRVPWERVDVSFRRSKQRFFAHSTIQVKTYLINSDGSDVIFHMIDNFLL
ncbi:putative lipase YDR444W [Curcuma longa]|uniref:putative lipase YDR444W n=1 Tax=Curcuma longa TaxID=136217 RepID=UPI003D9F413D